MSDKNNFEDKLKELQSIIEKLESETLSLDQMIKLFEDGMKLMKICRLELNEVEDRIKILVNDGDTFKEKVGIDKI